MTRFCCGENIFNLYIDHECIYTRTSVSSRHVPSMDREGDYITDRFLHICYTLFRMKYFMDMCQIMIRANTISVMV